MAGSPDGRRVQQSHAHHRIEEILIDLVGVADFDLDHHSHVLVIHADRVPHTWL